MPNCSWKSSLQYSDFQRSNLQKNDLTSDLKNDLRKKKIPSIRPSCDPKNGLTSDLKSDLTSDLKSDLTSDLRRKRTPSIRWIQSCFQRSDPMRSRKWGSRWSILPPPSRIPSQDQNNL